MHKTFPLFVNRIFNKVGPPIHLIWFVTAMCNLKCSHCFYHRQISGKSDELSFDAITKIILNMPPMLSISLTGGEPFLRSDLADIAHLIFRKKITKNIVLFSNGYDTGNIIKTMEKILLETQKTNIFLGISIDGFEDIHDRYRNMPGSYRKAMETLRALKKMQNNFSRLNVGVGITLHHGNKDIVAELRDDIYAKLGIRPSVTLIRGEPALAELKEVNPDAYKKIVCILKKDKYALPQMNLSQAIISMRAALGHKISYETIVNNRRSYKCYAGSLMAVIYENGNVYPCEMLKDSILGNLKDYDYDIVKLWKTERAEAVRKIIRSGDCHCTYECQYTCNTLYNIRFLPFLLAGVLKYFIVKSTGIIRGKNE